MSLAQILKFAVPAVMVPFSVFVTNWIVRHKKGYSITAPADFLLAVMIFDLGVLCTIQEASEFVQYAEFKTITAQWHVLMFILSCAVWYVIVTKPEQILNGYYSLHYSMRGAIPLVALGSAWIGVWIVVLLHTSFFLYQGIRP